jgi:hypothetical protein
LLSEIENHSRSQRPPDQTRPIRRALGMTTPRYAHRNR